LSVGSNDKTREHVELTVQAEVVLKVTFTPEELRILLRDENTECPEVELKSVDGQPFAIKNVRTTVKEMTIDYDPSVEAKRHVISPKIDLKGFHRRARGRIELELTHPECEEVTIEFTLVPVFLLHPHLIVVFDAEPGKPVKKALDLANNLTEDFEVVSVRPEKGLISVLSKKKVENVYEFELEIMPPSVTAEQRFEDTLHIDLRSGKQLEVRCVGFYKKPEVTGEIETE
jgi:hypothetical protein